MSVKKSRIGNAYVSEITITLVRSILSNVPLQRDVKWRSIDGRKIFADSKAKTCETTDLLIYRVPPNRDVDPRQCRSHVCGQQRSSFPAVSPCGPRDRRRRSFVSFVVSLARQYPRRYASVLISGTSDASSRESPCPWILSGRAGRRIAQDIALPRRRQRPRERPQGHDHLRPVFRLLHSHFVRRKGVKGRILGHADFPANFSN